MVLTGEPAATALHRLRSNAHIAEAAILSTCARTEIYVWVDAESALEDITGLLLDLSRLAKPYLVVRREREAAEHLFRVASGLESQVVGEQEIAGQVRSALVQAREAGGIGPRLDALFRAAISCGRRVRRDTAIGAVDLSVARAAANMARERLDVSRASILVVGAGGIARLLVEEFRECSRIALASRSTASAARMAKTFQVETLELGEAVSRVDEFDVLCCATRSREPIFTAEHFGGKRPSLVFDLSVPRNVAVDPARVPSRVTIFDVDHVRAPGPAQSADAALVDSIIAGELHDYLSRESIQQVAPIIQALRAHVDAVRLAELGRVERRLAGLTGTERDLILELSDRLIDRMFHHLVVRLRLAALTDPELIRAAEFFFAHGEDSLFPLSNEAPEGETTGETHPGPAQQRGEVPTGL